jgi:UDP-N-acetylglucosamine--N-acetylmuramyl-(pentapeptide) pyrophosphoryl-undecaprenol N-acetylglucosamine transferase
MMASADSFKVGPTRRGGKLDDSIWRAVPAPRNDTAKLAGVPVTPASDMTWTDRASGPQQEPLRIAFAGGGSGGHIYPAVAVAREALARLPGPPAEVLFVVSDGLEKSVVEGFGLPYAEIPATRLVAKNLLRILPQMWAGIQAARVAFRRFRPHVVYGTGGFVSFPAVVAAWLEGIPSLLHEPNTVPGRANRFLARIAKGVVTHFPQTRRHFPHRVRCLELGTPLRYEFDNVRKPRSSTRTVLILGGSQGARSLNVLVRNLYPQLAGIPALKVVHITGRRDYDEIVGKGSSVPANIEILPYAEEMDQILYRTDLAICRSGALTVSELVEFQIPAIYVPYLNSVGNHQFENAKTLMDRGASDIIEEPNLSGEHLLSSLKAMLQPGVLEQKRQALAALRRPGATRRVLEALEGLVRTTAPADD